MHAALDRAGGECTPGCSMAYAECPVNALRRSSSARSGLWTGPAADLAGLTGALLLRRIPPLEVALELPGDRLAARLGQLGCVLALLEVADVLSDVLVLLGELRDAALPGTTVLGQVTQRDAGLEQVLDLTEQRERGL